MHHILSFQCLPGIGLQRRCCFLLDLLPSRTVFQVSIFQKVFPRRLEFCHFGYLVGLTLFCQVSCTLRITFVVFYTDCVSHMVKQTGLCAPLVVRILCPVVIPLQGKALSCKFLDRLYTVRCLFRISILDPVTVDIFRTGQCMTIPIGISRRLSVPVFHPTQLVTLVGKRNCFSRLLRDASEHTVRTISQKYLFSFSILQGCQFSAIISGNQCISILILDLYHLSGGIKNQQVILFVFNLIALSICQNGQSQVDPALILPCLCLAVIIKIMSCTIFICILIVFLVSYILFFQRLQMVQPPSIPISQIRFPVIGIVYKVQADRHPASTRIPDTAGKHQISVIIIDITRSCPSHILAVVSPVVFQSGIVQISNQYTRTAIFRLDRKIRRHIFGILSILLHCPHHQTAIHSGLIPFFYHTGNGKT